MITRPARDLAAPPEDLPPEQLFALLVEPDPSLPLACRLAGLEDVALEVHALGPAEHAAAWWAAERAPRELRRARYAREIVARALWAHGARAFGSAEGVGTLSVLELRQLGGEVLDALATCGPTYARSDWPAWQEVLGRGARHNTMASIATGLAACADYGHGAVIYRPDRYWGRPIGQLLDGHWMVYRAARNAWVNDEASAPRSIADALRQAQMARG